jgi:tRNA A-37 threonylcarbamoyl transferase component Bud32
VSLVTDSNLDHVVKSALEEPPQRVRRLDLVDGRQFWLKRVERLSGRLRLQKGNPARTFEMERAGLAALADAGVPVAPVVAEGPDWMLMPDAGPVLPHVVAAPDRSEDEKLAAFAAAGRALGRLHWAGLVHGRPAVRDICWDGHEARFIDLERFRHGRHGGLWQAADIVMFAQTCFTQWPGDSRWLDAALAAYETRWLSGPAVLVRGLARLRPQSRELRAVGQTLARLRNA